jgi:hypothetical protein
MAPGVTSAPDASAVPESTGRDRDAARRPSVVTVAIPTHNRLEYLRQAVRSVTEQSYQYFEVVILDNASTDGTEEAFREQADPRVRYVRHSRNIGANANFAAAYAVGSGDYVVRLDSDDLLLPGYLETCVRVLDGDTSLIAVCPGIEFVDAEGMRATDPWPAAAAGQQRLDAGSLLADVAQLDAPLRYFNGIMLRRALAVRSGVTYPVDFPYQAGSDVLYFVELNTHGPFLALAAPLFAWRHHSGNTFAGADSFILRQILGELALRCGRLMPRSMASAFLADLQVYLRRHMMTAQADGAVGRRTYAFSPEEALTLEKWFTSRIAEEGLGPTPAGSMRGPLDMALTLAYAHRVWFRLARAASAMSRKHAR